MSTFAFKPVTRAGFMLAPAYPETWQSTRLRFLCDFNPSKKQLADLDPATPVSFVPMEKVSEDGVMILDEDRPIENVSTGYTFFADGDVLVAKITPCFENGKGAECKDLTNGFGFGTTEFHVLRSKHLDSRFLFYLTASDPFRTIGATEMSGAAGQKRVPESFLQNLITPLPPLPTQRRIAAFLDRETRQIDSLIASKEELFRLLEEKRASLISHAVTRGLPAPQSRQAGLNPKAKLKPSGIPWLGDVPAHWSVAQVGHRYHVDLGKMLDAKKISGDYLKPYLRNQDVQWSGINTTELPQMDIKPGEESRYALLPGDLLVCEGGECGRCSIWTETQECYYQKALHRLRPRKDRDYSGYFRFLMEVAVNTGVFASDSNANTIGHLPAEKFRNYRMVFPPVEEQRLIADYLFQQEAYFKYLRLNIQESITLLREKRGSLISAAVTGEMLVP